MIERYINNSSLNADIFLQRFNLKFPMVYINDYDLLTIVWNFALMFVPLALGHWLGGLYGRTALKKFRHKFAALALFSVWLLFFPNTAYIMSEIRHLNNYCPSDIRYHVCLDNLWTVFFFFLYAFAGWLAFYFSLRQMGNLALRIGGARGKPFFLALIFPLTALGVLLGLINRWNSWEILSQPFEIFRTATYYVSDWQYFKNWLILSLGLAGFYYLGKLIIRDE